MKKLLVGLLLVSSIANGHSQSPTMYGGKGNMEEAISLVDSKNVVFTLTNLHSQSYSYTFTINGEEVAKTEKLRKDQHQQVTLSFPTLVKKKPESFRVCSIQNKDTGFKTKVCSLVQLVRL